ncbi:hypothetical protein [Bacillus sp. FJAT-22090]|uniref:hypothetical protein n=1 Tax=Bacillus sp. FJAT-22090 TaxID=1581038 RepID=UPI0011A76E8B|nr:hypothetical protein [Bacillus sp. FJAT-22090]
MKKFSYYLYGFVYIVCAFVTVGAFAFANLSTKPPAEYSGGNGNIGLLPLLFLFPLIIIFIALTISFTHEYMYRKLKKKTVVTIAGVSLLSIAAITSTTMVRAYHLKSLLTKVSPNYQGDSKVPLLNINSNDVFFNFFTFILLLFFSLLVGGLLALKDKKP